MILGTVIQPMGLLLVLWANVLPMDPPRWMEKKNSGNGVIFPSFSSQSVAFSKTSHLKQNSGPSQEGSRGTTFSYGAVEAYLQEHRHNPRQLYFILLQFRCKPARNLFAVG